MALTYYQSLIEAGRNLPPDAQDEFYAQEAEYLRKLLAGRRKDVEKVVAGELAAARKAQLAYRKELSDLAADVMKTDARNYQVRVQALTDRANAMMRARSDMVTARSAALSRFTLAAMDRANVSASETQNDRELLQAMVGDATEAGIASQYDPLAPELVAWVRANISDDPEALLADAPQSLANWRQLDEAARQQDHAEALARSAVEELGRVDPGAPDAERIIQQAATMLDDAATATGEMPMVSDTGDTVARQVNTYLKSDDEYQEMSSRLDSLMESSDADNYFKRMGKVVADPAFRAWAESNGFDIGNARTNADGELEFYVPSRADGRAVRRFARQLYRDPKGQKTRRTRGPLVEVEVRTGEPKPLPDFNVPGALEYVSTDDAEYVRDAGTGEVYILDASRDDPLAPVENAAGVPTEGWRPLGAFRPDGSLVGAVTRPTLKPILTDGHPSALGPVTEEDLAAFRKRAEAGRPTFTVAGERAPLHAADAPGTTRVRAAGGTRTFAPGEVVQETVVQERPYLGLREAVDYLRGRRAAARAGEADPVPPGEPRMGLAERAVRALTTREPGTRAVRRAMEQMREKGRQVDDAGLPDEPAAPPAAPEPPAAPFDIEEEARQAEEQVRSGREARRRQPLTPQGTATTPYVDLDEEAEDFREAADPVAELSRRRIESLIRRGVA